MCAAIDFPAEDRKLSPITGWTRQHWMKVLEKMLLGVLNCFDDRELWPQIPASADGDALAKQLRAPGGASEKLERTMMLAAIYMSVTGKTTIDGFDGDIAEIYRRGIAESLKKPYGQYGDPGLRCGPGAHLSMLVAWDQLVEPFDAATKAVLAKYLKDYSNIFPNESNLLLFHMTPTLIIDRLGGDYNTEYIDNLFERILNMYRGEGWFIDGWNQQYDNYNFWGFQLYLHLFMCFSPRWRDRFGSCVEEITTLHEKTFPYWFDADGAPIPKGRSLNYRFAVLSGLAWSQRSGFSKMSGGLARRISSGCIKHFAQDKDCLNDNGILPIGYHGENTAIGEDYTDTGAPYWAATGLMALTLPEDHPFWTETEQAGPADSDKVSRIAIPGAQMSIKVGGPSRESRMYIGGELFRHIKIWQSGSKYYQHAYSSKLGFALAGDQGDELSAGRTGLSADGENWAYRTRPQLISVDESSSVSEWNAWQAAYALKGRVVTESFYDDDGETHVFAHYADTPQFLRIGGWAIQCPDSKTPECKIVCPDEMSMEISNAQSKMHSTMKEVADKDGEITGKIECVKLVPRQGFSHSHLFGGYAAWPQWTSLRPIAPGEKITVRVSACVMS